MAIPGKMRIDHVVYAVADLDATGRRFLEEYGLSSAPGGFHARWGTANRIVPLGSDYIELICVVDEDAAADSRLGAALQELGSDSWFAVCLSDNDIENTATRLGLHVDSGSRTRTDGSVVSWRSAGIEAESRRRWMPFFIAWDVPEGMHPGVSAAPRHPSGATRISWVEVAGDSAALDRWLGGAQVPIRVVETLDGGGVQAVGLSTPSGELVLD